MPCTLILAAALALAAPPGDPPPQADDFRPEPTWKPLGQGLWFDPGARCLVLRARVVLREGPLEHLLCVVNSKEHESILATRAIPRQIHAGLILTGAEPGHPARFHPKFEPPTGTPITIELQWTDAQGKVHRDNARDWVNDARTDKPLDHDWVFAGSELYTDPTTQQVRYAADSGDVITVANFASATLDVPFASTADDANRTFVANTPRVPPKGTDITMYLRPALGRRPRP